LVTSRAYGDDDCYQEAVSLFMYAFQLAHEHPGALWNIWLTELENVCQWFWCLYGVVSDSLHADNNLQVNYNYYEYIYNVQKPDREHNNMKSRGF
jgi:hypothetical protein